jgi:hypothetical protein
LLLRGHRPEKEEGSGEDTAEGGNLGVGHAPVDARVDADELDEKPPNARKNEVQAGEPAYRLVLLTELPDDPEDDDGEEELVDGGGLDEGVGRVGGNEGAGVRGEAVGQVDSPGEGGVDAVVAVAGGEAADASDAVADGGGGGGEVKHAEGAYAGTLGAFERAFEVGGVALPGEGGDAGEETSEPGEAGLEPVEEAHEDFAGVVPAGEEDLMPGGGEFANVLELVPGLGSDDAGDDDEGDDVEGVGVDAVADEVAVEDDCAADGGEPEHQAEGADVDGADSDVGVHADVSIAVGGAVGG